MPSRDPASVITIADTDVSAARFLESVESRFEIRARKAVIVGTGAIVSILNVEVPLPLLPAPSVWVTCTVYCAFAAKALSLTDQLPLETGTLLKVCNSVPPVPEPL